jgi:hypothetical protein
VCRGHATRAGHVYHKQHPCGDVPLHHPALKLHRACNNPLQTPLLGTFCHIHDPTQALPPCLRQQNNAPHSSYLRHYQRFIVSTPCIYPGMSACHHLTPVLGTGIAQGIACSIKFKAAVAGARRPATGPASHASYCAICMQSCSACGCSLRASHSLWDSSRPLISPPPAAPPPPDTLAELLGGGESSRPVAAPANEWVGGQSCRPAGDIQSVMPAIVRLAASL